MVLEFLFIFALLLLNGFFAASEIAVVTSRKSLIKKFAEAGSSPANKLLKLQSEPDRFLATVQVGVTFLSALTSAIGGAASVKTIEPLIAAVPVPLLSRWAPAISLGLVVIVISYFSLIIGELVPKSLALRNPEKVGLFVAGPITFVSHFASFFVAMLTASTNLVLRPFGAKAFSERSFISEEEIKLLIEEGKDKGIFEATEHELIHSVFKFTDISVKGVMVPVTSMVAFSIDEVPDVVVRKISEENFSRYPVFNLDRSEVRGILYNKDVFNELAHKREILLQRILHPALFVPETMKISALLREMQKTRQHMAIVIDEYGAVAGLATIEDLIEEIVGEIQDEYDTETPVQTLRDGALLVDASLAIRDLNEDYSFEIPESNEYDTLGGFLISHLQRLPSVGDVFQVDGHRFTIVTMKGRRVLKIKVERVPEDPAVEHDGGKKQEE
ncbi:MAG: hemolysin family protein [Nitrospiraceae bacterium]|nr:hemolysin family protein [Nitrospiraceae bacterium]